MKGKRKRGRPKNMWKTQVEKECWFGEKDAMNRVRWTVGVGDKISGVNPATPIYGDKTYILIITTKAKLTVATHYRKPTAANKTSACF